MDISANTWFYLLSSIAQTCGAILALSATFVIFKYNEIAEGLKNYRGRVNSILEIQKISEFKPYQLFGYSAKQILEIYKKNENSIISNYNYEYAISVSNKYPYDDLIRATTDRQGTADDGRKWSEKMVELLQKNIELKTEVDNKLKWSVFLLVITIVYSYISLIFGKINQYIVGEPILLWTCTVLGIISLLYTSWSIIFISNKETIT